MINSQTLDEWEKDAIKTTHSPEVDDPNLIAPQIYFKKDAQTILALIEEIRKLQEREAAFRLVNEIFKDALEVMRNDKWVADEVFKYGDGSYPEVTVGVYIDKSIKRASEVLARYSEASADTPELIK